MSKNTQLINTVQKALQDLIDEGTYQKIVAAWGLFPVKAAEINQGPAFAAANASPSASPSP